MGQSAELTRTAVILAAGMGVRLRDIVSECPKGLLEVGGEMLLGRSLRLLRACGIEQVFVATGFQNTLLAEGLRQVPDAPELCFVHNARFAKSGSMHSLYLLRGQIQEDFLLLESDLLYEQRALETLITQGSPDMVLISGFTQSQDEVWIHGETASPRGESVASGRIHWINKQPNPEFQIQGELVGITWLALGTFHAMCAHHEYNLTFPCSNHYEETLSALCEEREIAYLRVADLLWTEIDNANHYERAVQTVHPRIVNADQRKS
ncbi:MAG: phosphocholine cytidylyltransferase family protein [SAR324 cluster bacterium]|nr:phosphocholine cytidylyltransferase family protein [SAR324 cluster bacterium]MDP7629877.1 phosphocholine cytidylyltransferase family protein [SAR324 cluster bacterium]